MNVAVIEEEVTGTGCNGSAVVERMKNYDVPSCVPEQKQTGRC